MNDERRSADSRSEVVDSPVGISAPPTAAAMLARLRWRCRRGMRELDVLLERYVERHYLQAPAAEQRAFEALVELQDPQLFAFVMRRERPADPELVHVIARLTDPGS